jgi:WD40 repeat protein
MTARPGLAPSSARVQAWADAHLATLRRIGTGQFTAPAVPSGEGPGDSLEPGPLRIQVAEDPRWLFTAAAIPGNFAVKCVAMAVDERERLLIATCGSNANEGQIWDAATGERMITLTGHTSTVNKLAWSTLADGRLMLATASWDSTARIWDPATGECLTTLTGHTRDVNCADWGASSDGHPLLATGSDDDSARIWDPLTGECLTTLTGHTESVISVAWSAAGDGHPLLTTGSRDASARLWDPVTGECLAALTGHTHWVSVVAWATTGAGRPLLASGSYDNTVRIWDTAGDCLATLTGHTESIYGIAWGTIAGERLLLATASFDDTARIWDPTTGECLATIEHPGDVNSVALVQDPALGPEGTRALLLATAGDDGVVRVYPITASPGPALDRGPVSTPWAWRAGAPVSGQVAAVETVHVLADPVTLAASPSLIWTTAWAVAEDGRLLLATGHNDDTARIWDPLTGESLTALTGHTDTVRGVAWGTTGDGRLLLATSSYDHTARIWDPTTGECLITLTGHTDSVRGLAWGTNTDGRLLLATGGGEGTARIWDPITGECLTILTGHTDSIYGLAWGTTNDMRLLLATCSSDDTARIWDPTTGECLATITEHTGDINAVAWATTSDRRLLLATGGDDHTARIWDIATRECLTTLTGHDELVFGVAWASTGDGRLLLATAGWDDTVRIWDATGNCLATIQHLADVNCVAVIPDPRSAGTLLVATGCDDGRARVYSITTPSQPSPGPRARETITAAGVPARSPSQALRTASPVSGVLAPVGEVDVLADPMTLDHDNWIVWAAAWAVADDGRLLLATGDSNATARIWDPATGECLTTLTGHTGSVYGVAWGAARDGRLLLATAGSDNTARIWDAATGECLTTLTGHTDSIQQVAWAATSDGRLLLATGGSDATARIWDPATGECLTTLTDHSRTIYWVAFASANDERLLLATGSGDRTARIWDTATGECLTTLTGHTNEVVSLAWATTTDGQLLLATGSTDDTARIWDAATGECLTTLTGHTGTIRETTWGTTGDGRLLLATAGADDSARIWDPHSGECLANIEHPSGVNCAAFHTRRGPGRPLLLATGCLDNYARVYSFIPDVSPSLSPETRAAADSPGMAPATGAPLRLEVAGNAELTLTGHAEWVWAAAWTGAGEGPLLATGSRDKTARLWDTSTGQCVTTLTGHEDQVFGVAVTTTHDGRLLLATASSDNAAKIWDTATGECLTTLTEHDDSVYGVAWATASDGRLLLATCSWDATARIWDPLTGECLTTLTGHTRGIWAVAWATTRDAQLLLATAGLDGTARIWNTTGECLATLTGHTADVHAVAWGNTSDGRLLLATGSNDGTARIWDAGTGECLATLTGHDEGVYGLAWAAISDGRLLLATGSHDNTARIWDPRDGECMATIPHANDVNVTAWSPVVQHEAIAGPAGARREVFRLATGCDDGAARIYRVSVEVADHAAGLLTRDGTGAAMGAERAQWASDAGVLAAAVTGLFRLGERELWPPLGLLADLIALTSSDHAPETLNDPSLAALVNHPVLAGMRALPWPAQARVAFAALLVGAHPHDQVYAPPPAPGVALQSALASTLRTARGQPARPRPAMAATELAGLADALPPRILTLLTILGPGVAAIDPTVPLRLAHVAAHIPQLDPQLLTLLGNSPTGLSTSTRPSHGPEAHRKDTPTIAYHGPPTRLIPTHLGLPSDLFDYYERTGQLLYRHHTGTLNIAPRPYTFILDTTPPTYGPVETVLRTLTHLITTTLWSVGASPVLITTTRPYSPQPLTTAQHLLHIWSTRTLAGPDLDTPLRTASALDQPIVVLTHHQTAASHRLRATARMSVVTTHTPTAPAPPAPTNSFHHHIPADPAAAQLAAVISAILTSPGD